MNEDSSGNRSSDSEPDDSVNVRKNSTPKKIRKRRRMSRLRLGRSATKRAAAVSEQDQNTESEPDFTESRSHDDDCTMEVVASAKDPPYVKPLSSDEDEVQDHQGSNICSTPSQTAGRQHQPDDISDADAEDTTDDSSLNESTDSDNLNRPSTYFYVGLSSQVDAFMTDLNNTRKCRNTYCRGNLQRKSIITKGKGGAVEMVYKCDGCVKRKRCDQTVTFNSSMDMFKSQRLVTNLALCVAFIISGQMYSVYQRVLGMGLGIATLTDSNFYKVVTLLYSHVGDLLEEQIEEAKEDMKKIQNEELGSWERAVTCSDGVWQTRGHYSKNATYTIRNYLNNSILYAVHQCQKGYDKTAKEPLYKGTSKSAEGYSTGVAFEQAKEEGLKVAVHWQDADSSSASAIQKIMPEAKIMKCLGHVGRAHNNQLDSLKDKKTFTKAFKDRHKIKFPDILTVKCVCEGKNHNYAGTSKRDPCGCLSDGFKRKARINHWCAANQCENNPEKYADTLRKLGKYHSRDIHQWEGGECGFHPLRKCVCKKCPPDAEPLCDEAVPYKTVGKLTCPLHALGYEIETSTRADDAHNVIHPEMGRGHSNLVESSHNVLIRYRSKDVALNRLHYIVSTNIGLLQANMTWKLSKDTTYHWIVPLYERLNLPVFAGMVEEIQKATKVRSSKLERKKSDACKDRRMSQKTARVQEQEERKQWVKRQKTQHTYGQESDDDDDDDDDDSDEDHAIPKPSSEPSTSKNHSNTTINNPEVNMTLTMNSKKSCSACGSKTHQRRSHRDCPFNKRKLPTEINDI